ETPGDGGETPGDGGETPGDGEGPVETPSESAPGGGLDPDGGASPQEEGSSSLTDTGEEAPAASAQGNGKELAETGAAETTFLVIGAATMIAGGVGFRVLPRLMTGRGGVAA
ncbi:LPXTG cell wall anchor domain-containing protein, partial [Streptomyces sp. E2N171]|uniref:LPXTG cell wall anchor domain-containing protein n=1 Tax=Streptomyces sp. E2N171 TaxID=1851914 RepID=UPI001EE8B1C2